MSEQAMTDSGIRIVYEYRIKELRTGDGIDIERRVKGIIDKDRNTFFYRNSEEWMPYCYVNTGAGGSTQAAALHINDLLNQYQNDIVAPYCGGGS